MGKSGKSSPGRPGDHEKQNRQVHDAVKRMGLTRQEAGELKAEIELQSPQAPAGARLPRGSGARGGDRRGKARVTMSRRECPRDVVNALVEVEQRDQPCWSVCKVLGSMLVLDFGAHVTVRTRRGEAVEVGASSLSIRNVYWVFHGSDGAEFESDTVTREHVSAIRKLLNGVVLSGVTRGDEDIDLTFSDRSTLRIDLTNVHQVEAEEEIATLRLSGGMYIDLMPDGRFVLNVEESVRERVAA